MKQPKKPITKVPKSENIVGAGGNELLNPKSRALKGKAKTKAAPAKKAKPSGLKGFFNSINEALK